MHLNLAYRWFCGLGLSNPVPDHSTFSKNRHGRFRDADVMRQVFETVVHRCISEGRSELYPTHATRAVSEFLAVLDDAAFAAATDVAPKFVSPVDPVARWTAATGGPACFAYCDNYLIDLKCAVIMDVEPTTAVRQAEVAPAKTMIVRTAERFGIKPELLADDTGFGSAEMLGWLVYEQGIEPHIRVFDKSERMDGAFSRADFAYDHKSDTYVCPAEHRLQRYRRPFATPRAGVTEDNRILYRFIVPANSTVTSAR